MHNPPMRRAQDRQRERELRGASTDAEERLWFQLRDRRLCGWKFRRQKRVGPWYVDFACLDARLVVELDGGQHAERRAHDAERTRQLNDEGFRVMRFWNDEVLLRTDDVLAAILAALEESSRRVP